MRVLRALAAIRDIKDFRVRTLMVHLGMDPSQPSLWHRELIKDSRIAMVLQDQVRSLKNRCRELEAECRRLASQRVEAERKLDEGQADLVEEVRFLEAANSALQSRLAETREEVAKARAIDQDAEQKIEALVRFLMGSDDLRTLDSVYRLALRVCAAAADEALGWSSGLSRARQTFRVLELQQWFKNKLRSALEPTEKERLLVEYRIRIKGQACVTCGGASCEEGETIAWAHVRCADQGRPSNAAAAELDSHLASSKILE